MPRTNPLVETERQFQEAILALATLYGWKTFFVYDSRKSPPGFPDLVLARAGSPLLLAELKRETGRLSHAQQDWLDVLGQVQEVRAACWRPSDWGEIEALLRGRP